MLGDSERRRCSSSDDRATMPLYEYECERAATASRRSRSSRIRSSTSARRAAARSASCCRRPRFSSRDPACTSPTTPKKCGRRDVGIDRRASSERQRRKSESTARIDEVRVVGREDRRHQRQQDRLSRRSRRTGGARLAAAARLFRSIDLQVLAERRRRVRPPQREVHHRLQESRACCRCRGGRRRSGSRRSADRFSSRRRPLVSWISPVRSLVGGFERREDVGRQDVAADDREVRRRFLARRLLDHVADPVDARRESRSASMMP